MLESLVPESKIKHDDQQQIAKGGHKRNQSECVIGKVLQ